MNKRQKKKRDKKRAWDADYREYKKAMELYELQKNGEGYYDPTAYHALRNAIRKGY